MKFLTLFARLCLTLLPLVAHFRLSYAQQTAEFKGTSSPFRFNIRPSAPRPATFAANTNGSTSPPFRFNIRPRTRRRLVPASYALFIANATYDDKGFTDLPDAAFDAKAVGDTLKTHYGFQPAEVTVVANADYDKLETTLQEWSNRSWLPGEQLLVYVSGHGEYVNRQGYLIMKDSDKGNLRSYFSLAYLKSLIQQHECPHILLVLDICYGGAINQTASNEVNTSATKVTCEDRRDDLAAYFSCAVKDKTRLYLSSGSLDVVRGGRVGAHSPFTESLLQKLSETAHSMAKFLPVSELRSHLKKDNPELTFSSEAAGDFLFVLDRTLK